MRGRLFRVAVCRSQPIPRFTTSATRATSSSDKPAPDGRQSLFSNRVSLVPHHPDVRFYAHKSMPMLGTVGPHCVQPRQLYSQQVSDERGIRHMSDTRWFTLAAKDQTVPV